MHPLIIYALNHGLRTPGKEIVFTARSKINSHSQILRYSQSIFCLPHRPEIFRFLWFMSLLGVRSPCIERNPSQVKEKWQAMHSYYWYIFAKISNIILSFLLHIFAYVHILLSQSINIQCFSSAQYFYQYLLDMIENKIKTSYCVQNWRLYLKIFFKRKTMIRTRWYFMISWAIVIIPT